MSMLPPVFVELKANVGEFKTAMGEARTEIKTLEKEGSGSYNKLAAVGKASLFAIGASAIALGGLSLEMADTFEQSHAKLEQALKNNGASWEQYKDQVGSASQQMEQYGFTNAQTEEAIATMTTALKDPKKALADLGLAADLAKYKHIDLATAALAVARAQEGNLKPLKQLGIDLPISAGGAKALAAAQLTLATQTQKAKTFLDAHTDAMNKSSKYHLTYMQMLDKVHASQEKVNAISKAGTLTMDALSKAVHGQAAAAAETFAGKMAALKAQSEDVAKNIGMKLIPILTSLMSTVESVIKWFEKHKAIAIALATVIGGALTIAIAAYIAKLVEAGAKQSIEFVKDVAKGAAWVAGKLAQYAIVVASAVASAAATAAAWIAANLAMIIASGGIILAIGLLVAAGIYVAKHWKQIWSDIKAAVAWAWDGIKAIGSGIGHFFSSVFSGVAGIIKGYINIYIGLINDAIGLINKIPHLHLFGHDIGIPHISNIPMLANGGIVNSPTVAMIGEAGPEAVIPLSKMGNGGPNVVINVKGSIISQKDLVTQVRNELAQMMRRNGANIATLGI